MRTWIQILLFCLTLGLSTGVATAQKAVITCEKTVHNFGEIKEADGKVSHTFVVKNEGTGPLVISNVTASCGCTTPDWTKEPIPAGKTGEVKVTFDPKNRPGNFMKTIRLYGNGMKNGFLLSIRGKVLKNE
ncbi:MAG: DUF1573 domain-containing protein [Bacteroides sp.]|nr:DUF1573 domain-containing protein [Bacteroides sp.]